MTMVLSGVLRTAFPILILLLLIEGGSCEGAPEGAVKVETRQVAVSRISVISHKSFQEVVAALDSSIGHPDVATLRKNITAAQTETELGKIVNAAIGPSGLMEFARYDLGEVLRKELGAGAPQSLRLVVGNPLIMKELVKRVPDAGSYAPLTILVDERPGGVHLSYDRTASFLGPYRNPAALTVARELDAKVETLLKQAAN